jgi:hypothetical protein
VTHFTSPVVFDAVLLNRLACKRLTFGHYDLLSSKTHQSFPTVFYFGRYLGIFAEFYQLFAVAVISHAPAILSIEKLI